MNERVSLLQASKELGMSQQAVREYMKRGLMPIGYVVPSLQGKNQRYLIFRDKLDEYLGKLRTSNE